MTRLHLPFQAWFYNTEFLPVFTKIRYNLKSSKHPCEQSTSNCPTEWTKAILPTTHNQDKKYFSRNLNVLCKFVS